MHLIQIAYNRHNNRFYKYFTGVYIARYVCICFPSVPYCPKLKPP
jgi:hypothetical protein